MRTNLSDDEIEYIKDLKEALMNNEISEDEIININDQMMTVKQAIRLADSGDLSARNYHARQTNVK